MCLKWLQGLTQVPPCFGMLFKLKSKPGHEVIGCGNRYTYNIELVNIMIPQNQKQEP